MHLSYFDTETTGDAHITRYVKKLRTYRDHVQTVVGDHDTSHPEYCMAHVADPTLQQTLEDTTRTFKGIKHLVVVGAGGSILGVQAVHETLGEGNVQLHILDTIAPYHMEAVLQQLKKVKKVSQLAVCVVSKSGDTTETIANAGVLLQELEQQFGSDIYTQTICIGTSKTPFLATAKRLRATIITMPESVGGRFSVMTEAGLVPLALLGHNIDDLMAGFLDASNDTMEPIAAEGAARLAIYVTRKYTHYNFFACDPRLETLGRWYQQLHAESLGKSETTDGKPLKHRFVPTVSTIADLHATGQLYMSDQTNTYTDFVSLTDDVHDFAVPKKGIARSFGKHTLQDIATALYGSVVGTYQDRSLPYRATIFTEDTAYALGLFLGTRMLETMYVAHLLQINAFTQPNVELYKKKTRDVLGV